MKSNYDKAIELLKKAVTAEAKASKVCELEVIAGMLESIKDDLIMGSHS